MNLSTKTTESINFQKYLFNWLPKTGFSKGCSYLSKPENTCNSRIDGQDIEYKKGDDENLFYLTESGKE